MLYLTEQTWTKGASARDRDGRIVNPSSGHAVKWDLYAALRQSCFDYDHFWSELLRLKTVIKSLFGTQEPVWIWNDQASWEDVEKVIKKFR